jgi:hypothetical protein
LIYRWRTFLAVLFVKPWRFLRLQRRKSCGIVDI